MTSKEWKPKGGWRAKLYDDKDLPKTVRPSAKGRAHGADITCPLTTGIFVRIAAGAADEDREVGKKRITPYWRVITEDGSLNPKFPGGVRAQTRRSREEGHTISAGKGKKPPRVKDFETSLVRFK